MRTTRDLKHCENVKLVRHPDVKQATTMLTWILLVLFLAVAGPPAPGQPRGHGQPPPSAEPPPASTPQPILDLARLMSQMNPSGAQEEPTDSADTAVDQSANDYEQSIALTDTGLLDLHVRDLDIDTMLEMLSYEARVNIVTSTSVSGTISANLYNVTLEQALEATLKPNQFAYHVGGNTIFVGTPQEVQALLPPPTTRVFQLRYMSPSEAAEAVKAVLSEDANVVEGGGAVSASSGENDAEMGPAGSDYLIVTDQPERLDAAAELLQILDQRPQQVLIEATVLRATLNESNQFGIDFTLLGGVDFQDVSSVSNASTNLSTGQLPSADLQSTTFNINTDFTGNISGGGFSLGLIKDSIAGFIRALEDVTDVVVVGNPKVIALNKQEGEVIVGRRDGYLTTTVTETAAIQTVEFLETGTQIKFRPIINADGTVRLQVHPKDSNGGLTAANLPFEETTEAHADIIVDDGNTILIGGLFRDRTIRSKSQIPVLGDIPGVGLLFGSENDQTVREEVIILLTVHIIKETSAEQERHRNLLQDVELLRVGLRMGLLATGRERLAQAYYHEAVTQLEKGERDRALLNVRMTLNNLPEHLPALKLKEQLLKQHLWDEDGARMRAFVNELIDSERGVEEPPYDRPPPSVDHLINQRGEQNP